MNDIDEQHQREAIDWCFENIGTVSRTFALSIEQLNSPESEFTCVGYLMCRIADTVEDAPGLTGAQKTSLLDSYMRVLDTQERQAATEFVRQVRRIQPRDPMEPAHWDLVQHTPTVLVAFSSLPAGVQDIIHNWVTEMIDGMASFCGDGDGKVTLEEKQDLREYCYYVAGTVGHMLADIHLHRFSAPNESQLHANAEEFGLLLQFVNIIKDVHGDYHTEENIYVPETMLAEQDIRQQNILDASNIDGAERVLGELIEEARTYKSAARSYLRTIEKTGAYNMEALELPYLLSVATLRELETNSREALTEGGVKISRPEVVAIVGAVSEPHDMTTLESQIDEQPFHMS